jgi:hypothetical protein
MANTTNDQPGNDARNTGDRLGFPHPVADETSLDDAHTNTVAEGAIVYHDGTQIQESADLSVNPALGVLLNLPVYGDSSRAGPYVDGNKTATVGYRGSYTADLSTVSQTPTVGTYLDPAQNVFVKANVEGDVYEVMVR